MDRCRSDNRNYGAIHVLPVAASCQLGKIGTKGLICKWKLCASSIPGTGAINGTGTWRDCQVKWQNVDYVARIIDTSSINDRPTILRIRMYCSRVHLRQPFDRSVQGNECYSKCETGQACARDQQRSLHRPLRPIRMGDDHVR